jgi:predicted transposase YbfD/YdcC
MRELIENHFSDIEDTRCHCDVEHKLLDVLIIIMNAVLCGYDKPEDICVYGEEKLPFLRKYFGVASVPSKSTLSRILSMVDGEKVAECVVNIMLDLIGEDSEIIAVDGKTICSTAKPGSCREKLHIVTAYLTKNGVTLGQLSVDEKTNEIPVLRDLLDMIEIKGKTITADAMHCQKDTVAKIVNGGGNYVLGLKGNQEILFEEVSSYIDDCIADKNIAVETAQTTEKNRDRFEQRTCYKAPNIGWLEQKSEWAGLQVAFAVHRKTTTKIAVYEETSYYITSIDAPPEKYLEIVREHWKIESLHWQLDVVFSEDDCQVLSSNGQKTLNIFRKLALAIHKNYISSLPQKTKPSLKKNMTRSLLSDNHLLNVLSCVM